MAIPLVLALLSMIGPFSMDTPFPAFAEMQGALDVGAHELQLVVTVYMLAFAAMSLFYGPISDAVGRRPVILWGVAAYVVASIACAFAPTLELLLVGRAGQGLSAGAATIVSRTIIRDLFEGAQAQRLMSRVVLIFGIAPALAPIIGGWLVQWAPWPVIFWFMAALGLVLVVAILVVLPESHPPSHRVPLRVGEIVRGLAEVATVPAFHRATWAGTFVFAAQFLYIGGASIFMVELLGQGELDFWKLFVPMVGLMMIGSSVSGRMAGIAEPARLISIGYAVSLAGALIGVLVAFTAWAEVLPWNIVGISLVAFGNGLAYPNIQLVVLDLVPRRRGAAMSAASFLTLMFNAISAVTIAPWAARSVQWFSIAACGLVLAGCALWWWHMRVTSAVVDVPATTPDERVIEGLGEGG